jgi:hypothetical protein
MTTIDTNVSNYTLSELLAITEINDEDINKNEILLKTNILINKFKNKNPELSVFFKEIQRQLLQYAEGLDNDEEKDTIGKIVVEGFGNKSNEAIYPEGEKQTNEWYENQNIEQQVPGFKFLNRPCNPCTPLNNPQDYSCPFAINVGDGWEVSSIWKKMWST